MRTGIIGVSMETKRKAGIHFKFRKAKSQTE